MGQITDLFLEKLKEFFDIIPPTAGVVISLLIIGLIYLAREVKDLKDDNRRLESDFMDLVRESLDVKRYAEEQARKGD